MPWSEPAAPAFLPLGRLRRLAAEGSERSTRVSNCRLPPRWVDQHPQQIDAQLTRKGLGPRRPPGRSAHSQPAQAQTPAAAWARERDGAEPARLHLDEDERRPLAGDQVDLARACARCAPRSSFRPGAGARRPAPRRGARARCARCWHDRRSWQDHRRRPPSRSRSPVWTPAAARACWRTSRPSRAALSMAPAR